jgi:hypothetical protein
MPKSTVKMSLTNYPCTTLVSTFAFARFAEVMLGVINKMAVT